MQSPGLHLLSYWCVKAHQKKQLKRERVYYGSQSRSIICHGGETQDSRSLKQLVTSCPQPGNREAWTLAYTTALRPLTLPMQLKISSPLTVKKSLPVLINVTKIIPSRHAQRPISKVILGSVLLVAHSCHHAPPPQDHQGSSSAPGERDVLSSVRDNSKGWLAVRALSYHCDETMGPITRPSFQATCQRLRSKKEGAPYINSAKR